ncbi:MAG TPA: hypothetical protein VGG06_02360 [Thermoanaerobaculia bacterium]|jgi:hypothetical protein
MDVWEDFGHADLADAAYEDAGWAEARLLSLPPPGRRLAIAEEAQFQTRELALRLLVTDERLWHERPEASLEVSELAVLVAEAAARRKGSHLRLLGRRRTTRRGLPEILVGSGRGPTTSTVIASAATSPRCAGSPVHWPSSRPILSERPWPRRAGSWVARSSTSRSGIELTRRCWTRSGSTGGSARRSKPDGRE